MAVYIVGDIHGHLVKLLDLLIGANLIDQQRRWTGGTNQLWFMGDFFDRGPHGVGVVEMVMRLQNQAADAGGQVRALLGNHEIMFLSAQHFPLARKFMMSWKRNGGQETDMSMITSRQLAWLRSLPAMALVESRLLMHADAMMYLNYGDSLREVNETFAEILRGDKPHEWEQLLDDFSDRMAFTNPGRGTANAERYLDTFGGEQIIHGHTPIQYVTESLIPQQPYIYANRLCVNVDGGMYLGGTGFVYKLP